MTMVTKVVNEVTAERATDVAEEKAVDEAEQETDEGVGGEIEKILKKQTNIAVQSFKPLTVKTYSK